MSLTPKLELPASARKRLPRKIANPLAVMGQRWRFHVTDPAQVVPRPLFTLRLKNGLPVTLKRR